MIQGEQPSLARAVAFANPSDWDPSDEFVTALLAGLRANPFVRPVTVDTLLAETPTATVDDAPEGNPVVRNLSPVIVRKAPVTQAPTTKACSTGTRSPPSSATATYASRMPTAHCCRCSRSTSRTRPGASSPAGSSARSASPAATSSRSSTPRAVDHHDHVERGEDPHHVPQRHRSKVTIHIALESDKLLFPDGNERDVELPPGKHRRSASRSRPAARGRSP